MEDWIKAPTVYIRWASRICKAANSNTRNGATRANPFSRRPFSVSIYDIKVEDGGV